MAARRRILSGPDKEIKKLKLIIQNKYIILIIMLEWCNFFSFYILAIAAYIKLVVKHHITHIIIKLCTLNCDGPQKKF